jgi:NAD(P)-dependent dehydrogenase (short-subunit alcohol dehydrogenase family)
MTRFAGKAMVVTGAAQGIGRRVAERAASEGAAVLIVDRSPHRAEVVAAIGAAGGSAHAFDADLEDELGVRLLDRGRPLTLTPAGRHFFEQVSEIMRRLDALRPASRAAGHLDLPRRVADFLIHLAWVVVGDRDEEAAWIV